MRRCRLFRPSPAMVVATGALFVAIGGTSLAAVSSSTVPDAQGVFHACVNRANSAIRVVTSASDCRKPHGHGKHKTLGEFAVAWSQTGPPGSAGTNGTNATVNGVAAGGDLTGTYPSPTIAAAAVTPGKIGSIPAAIATNTGDVSIPGDASHNILSFDTNQVNIDGVHSTATNSSRLTAPIDGLYEVHGQAKWGTGVSGGFRELEIYEGAFAAREAVSEIPDTGGLGVVEDVSAFVHLHAGDYVILSARQTSGSAISITGTTAEGAPDTPEFDMHWVEPSS
jgi:hypothetical protein